MMFSNNISMLGLVAAVLVQLGTADLGDFWAYGPTDKMSSKQWRAALAAPNATGGFDIDGPASKGTPDSSSGIELWSLSVKVMADIPAKDDKSEYYTGTAISLTPPDSFVKKSKNGTEMLRPKSDWSLCAVAFVDLPDDRADDDGSCNKVLGKECVKDITDSSVFIPGQCVLTGIPESCKGTQITMDGRIEGSSLLTDPLLGLISSQPHEKGNNTDAEIAVNNYIPLVLGWSVNGTGEGPIGYPGPTLMCIKANKTTAGSEDLEDGGNGTLGMIPSTTFIGMMIAVVGLMVLV